MKQEEKTERTKNRTIEAAIKEFGKKGYASATIGTICSKYGIAKGLLYHNFTGIRNYISPVYPAVSMK